MMTPLAIPLEPVLFVAAFLLAYHRHRLLAAYRGWQRRRETERRQAALRLYHEQRRQHDD